MCGVCVLCVCACGVCVHVVCVCVCVCVSVCVCVCVCTDMIEKRILFVHSCKMEKGERENIHPIS